MKRLKVFGVIAVILVAGVVILASIGNRLPQVPHAAAVPAETKPDDSLTMAKYESLQTGMSFSAARDILGSSGQEMSRVELAGFETVMYGWTSHYGFGNMNAMFQNDRLISKAQFGLK